MEKLVAMADPMHWWDTKTGQIDLCVLQYPHLGYPGF